MPPRPKPRSPRLTKADRSRLSAAQQTRLNSARDEVSRKAAALDKLKDKKDAKREEHNDLRDMHRRLSGKLEEHPLSKTVRDKKEDVSIVKGQLEVVSNDVKEARNELDRAQRDERALAAVVKKELSDRSDRVRAPSAAAKAAPKPAAKPAAKPAVRRRVRGKSSPPPG